MTHTLWTRRKFLSHATGAATALALPAFAASASPLRGRFITHISVVRVNQIEVSPNRSIGQDEASLNTPQQIRARREAFARGCPNGKMTWAISWLALNDTRPEYQEARRLLASYQRQYGDEIWVTKRPLRGEDAGAAGCGVCPGEATARAQAEPAARLRNFRLVQRGSMVFLSQFPGLP